jgi:hypothetical protein
LLEYRACGMLGPAGIGKSHELARLANSDELRGLDVRGGQLALLAQTSDGLAAKLDALAEGITAQSVMYLDALDEVMVPVKTAGPIVAAWIRGRLASTKPSLRIGCRTAAWLPLVETAMRAVYAEGEFAVAVLQPLSAADVRQIAAYRGLDAEAFERAVQTAAASALAEQPLTLEMLLRIFEKSRSLPGRRKELFSQGMELLVRERIERREHGTAEPIPVSEALGTAASLACFALFSGRELFDLNDYPSDNALGQFTLGSLPGLSPHLEAHLRYLSRSGLCDSDGLREFRFAHRQFAEYLAGRRLAALLPHQAKSLLASSMGAAAGVAGPLRETAAFAAMESAPIAAWIAESDPEVIGMSEVADDALRRRATMELLRKFERHELTDAEVVGWDSLDLAGLCYAGIEGDLRPILLRRGPDCEDAQEFAIALIRDGKLSAMGNDLADLMLDPTAQLGMRQSAGYALRSVGTPAVCARLLPLLQEEVDFDLRGLTLQCNWPHHLSDSDLLTAITPRPERYDGPFARFLHDLDEHGFDAEGDRIAGLAWAREVACRAPDYAVLLRLMGKIARAAMSEIQDQAIADALADLILTAAENGLHSPLVLEDAPDSYVGRWSTDPILRRTLLDALARRAKNGSSLWSATRAVGSLPAEDDFVWLLEKATDGSLSMEQRTNYAELAKWLPWQDHRPCVEAWLGVRGVEPVASCLPGSLSMDVESKETATAKKWYREARRARRAPRRQRLRPSPAERIEHALSRSETDDPRFFTNVANELTLEAFSTRYGFERFLTRTPGWAAASPETRTRIIAAARRLLAVESDEPETALKEPLNTVFGGYMAAIFLCLEHDAVWLESQPSPWWQRWATYILREVRPSSDEPDEPKRDLLRILHERAPAAMRAGFAALVTLAAAEAGPLLISLFRVFDAIVDRGLDELLCDRLMHGRIPDDHLTDVAQFVLARGTATCRQAFLSCLRQDALVGEGLAERIAPALLLECPAESFESVYAFLQRRPELTPQVLANYAPGHSLQARFEDAPRAPQWLNPKRAGQLAALLLEAFPPESEPIRGRGGPRREGYRLRDGLISWLGDQRSVEAVETLRGLETRFRDLYPWLRRSRARAERSYRLAQWSPIPLGSVAGLLAAGERRLIRSDVDALDGVVEAIQNYASGLRREGLGDLDDLWNRPRGVPPSPREEERVSDKVCQAVRQYFREHAVTADREVQLYRRQQSAGMGGAPGSEADVLVRVPATGAEAGRAIAVPIEVKLAHNRESRTGMSDQLVNRYMQQLGVDSGAYVVVWMGRPRSLGRSPEEAREVLQRQADELAASSGVDLRVIVIDASLPTAASPPKRPTKAANAEPPKKTRSRRRKDC